MFSELAPFQQGLGGKAITGLRRYDRPASIGATFANRWGGGGGSGRKLLKVGRNLMKSDFSSNLTAFLTNIGGLIPSLRGLIPTFGGFGSYQRHRPHFHGHLKPSVRRSVVCSRSCLVSMGTLKPPYSRSVVWPCQLHVLIQLDGL